MHGLARLSMGNRALIALVTVFVMVFGVITTSNLKQELIPSLSLPTAVVITSYPGASPEVVEESVTQPVEQAVQGLQDLESLSSESSTGSSLVTVNMTYGTNMSTVQQDLQAAISRIEGILPEEADSQVFTGSVDDIPVLVVSASSDRSAPELAEDLENVVVPALEKVEGARAVSVSGAPTPQVLIDLDLDELTEEGLTSQDVSQAVQAAGARSSAGTLESGDGDLSVTVGEKLASAEDVADVVLTSTTRPGERFPLSDVAEVSERQEPATSVSRTDGRESLSMSITKTPDGNTVEVSDGVRAELDRLSAELGNDTRFTTVFDQAPFIEQSIEDLLTEGGLGLVMAVVVILLFLLSVRSTLVTAISIPVSVLIALIGLSVAGYSLNILTLSALTIAVGRVVDDSIVVIENIKRHLSYGEPKVPAILTAVREVAVAITAATITTVAVFLPIGLVGGQTGELFRPFAVTTALALLASLLVSLTIIPVLAYWFLASPSGAVDADQVRVAAEARERRSWLQRGYVPLLRAALRFPLVSVLVALLVLGGTVAMAPLLKVSFLGESGQDTLTVNQEFAPGLSLQAQTERAIRVEEELREVPGVQTVQTTVGSSGGAEAAFGGGGSADSASFSLTSAPDADQAAVQSEVQRVLDGFEDDEEVGALTVSSAGGGFGGSTDVEVVLTGTDPDAIEEAATAVTEEMEGISQVTEVTSSLVAEQPVVSVRVDEDAAAEEGLTPATISAQLEGILAPAQVGSIEVDGLSQDVVLRIGEAPVGLDELADYEVTGATGPVPLRDVAEVVDDQVAPQVNRTDGQRSATVSLTPADQNDLGTVTTEVTTRLAGLDLPEGVQAELGGVATEQSDAFNQLGLALLVAIAIVYVVMVATFKSLVQPLILLVSIPFAATGALAGLLLTDTALGVPSLIGMLMLIGIVVTNAIVLIDLVNHYRSSGQPAWDALVNGARQRLRPILMTAVATIFALLPMALGLTGGGLFVSGPLAIVVIGGLFSSTLLTLVLVPVLYELISRRADRREERRVRREAKATGSDPQEAVRELRERRWAEFTAAAAAAAAGPAGASAGGGPAAAGATDGGPVAASVLVPGAGTSRSANGSTREPGSAVGQAPGTGEGSGDDGQVAHPEHAGDPVPEDTGPVRARRALE
ncbi:efflux RND transporter permease subunit [Auraticoccus monumenti]|uniref:Hydrophobic/amphiphilic exporter-1, HAE1 family n=1 Tax=Auraticoccus monumenti TaxID=675864 RepID=A0A1G6S1D8_9ACTN|nr:efflux RND transporter permease subunit [Auraticoccus monumenti]SDD10483.1 hydrophobic/amphiphilic exporter-1, HAE1 family [Auraticoccus monumenti]